MTTMTARGLALLLATGLLTACGSGKGDNSSVPGIGAAGGVVVSQDGRASVTIPPGALSRTIQVTVEPATNPPAGHVVGSAYDFGPSGTTFAAPATISISYTGLSLPSGTPAIQLQLAKVVNGQWEAVAGSSVDPAAQVVNGATTAFSTYGLVAPSQPEPKPAVPGAPTGVSVSAGDGFVTVTWNPVTGATSYNAYVASQSGVNKGNALTLADGAARSGVASPYVWTGLTNGTTYYVVVTAVNAAGESAESAQGSGTPVAAPSLPPPIVPSPSTIVPATHTLTLTTEGTGTGVVTGAGIYASGSIATVTATPNVDSTFMGWSGPNGAECATGSVSMVASKSCTATFTLTGYTLTLSAEGPGIVTGAGMYPYGSTATVTATPNTGATLVGWSGPDGVECATGSVNMISDKSCTATFTTPTQPPPSPLTNISARAGVQTGDHVMIGGFWIGGTEAKTVLVRARGASLGGAPFNNSGVLADPTMQLYSGATVIAQNDNWQSTNPLCGSPATACGDVTQITATGLDPCQPNPGQTAAPPGCAQEAALLVTLPAGGYTVIVSGVGGTSGMGLVEVFEVGASSSRLLNISTRSRVQTGDHVMIGGFWIGGTEAKTVLVRARGGSLGGAPFNNPGVLADPTMQLYSGATVIAQNDNWQSTDPLCGSPATACGNVTQIMATGLDPCQPNPGQTAAPPGCAQEAALYVTLPPGGYTVIVSGVGGTSGMGLAEIFEILPPILP